MPQWDDSSQTLTCWQTLCFQNVTCIFGFQDRGLASRDDSSWFSQSLGPFKGLSTTLVTLTPGLRVIHFLNGIPLCNSKKITTKSFFLKKELKPLVHSRLSTARTRMSYGITPFYLPPDRGAIPAITPAEAGTRFVVPLNVAGWVDLARDVAVPMAVVRFEPGLRVCECTKSAKRTP